MSHINMTLHHNKEVQSLRKDVEEELKTKGKEYNFDTSWSQDGFEIKGPVEGSVKVNTNDVTVNVKLGFIASAFKTQIEDTLRESLEKVLR